MRYLFTLLVLLISTPGIAGDLDIYGYFEPQYFGFSQQEDFYQTQSNKLRIDVLKYVTDNVEFGANVNFMKYVGKTEYNLLDYLKEDLYADFADEERDQYHFAFRDTILLDNAYIKLGFDQFDLTIGRQQISYGTGYAWNPTFIYNDKDILDPTYEKPGHNAVRFDIPFTYTTGLMGFYSPGDKFDRSLGAGRFKTNFGRFDIALTAAYIGEETAVDSEADEPYLLTENRKLYGAEMVGELFTLGTWFEGSYSQPSETGEYYELLAGVDYTFSNGTYAMCEYYYNDLGHSRIEEHTLYDWLMYFEGQYRTLSLNNLFLFVDYPATDLIRLSTSAIISINDESAAFVPQMTYSMFQDVELILMGNFYIGKSGAMFHEELGIGGIARMKAYF